MKRIVLTESVTISPIRALAFVLVCLFVMSFGVMSAASFVVPYQLRQAWTEIEESKAKLRQIQLEQTEMMKTIHQACPNSMMGGEYTTKRTK